MWKQLALALALVASMPRASAGVTINEIMFRPAANQPEWIELYNDSDKAVDLEGWTVHDRTSGRPTLPHHRIHPGEFVVLTGDSAALLSTYPQVGEVIEINLPALNNGGDLLRLLDEAGELVEFVDYSGSWVGETGISLERLHPRLPPEEADSWGASADPDGGTPGKPNSLLLPTVDLALASSSFDERLGILRVSVAGVGLNPAIPHVEVHSDPAVSIELESEERVAVRRDDTLLLSYLERSNGMDSVSVTLILAAQGDERADNDTLRLTMYSAHPGAGLHITEIMYDGLDGVGGKQVEYIEIYNATSRSVRLLGWSLHESAGRSWRIEEARTLPPGRYLVVASTDLTSAYPVGSSSVYNAEEELGLNSTGDRVALLNPYLDTVDLVAYDPGWHWARAGSTKGRSLERRSIDVNSNDPTNWSTSAAAAGGTPGFRNSVDVEGISSAGAITASPRAFSPDEDGYQDVVAVNVVLETPGTVTVRVLDRCGREVARVIDGSFVDRTSTTFWDGTRPGDGPLPSGPYILHLTVINQTGRISTDLEFVAIARGFERLVR